MKEKSSKTAASLVNPNGESWHVNVYRDDDQDMYIGGPGWLELARAHNLSLGYFLMFHYEGSMVFTFRAFDLSTCEIAYPSIAQWITKKTLKQTLDDAIHKEEDDQDDDEQKPRIHGA